MLLTLTAAAAWSLTPGVAREFPLAITVYETSHVAVAAADGGRAMAVFVWSTFEEEPAPGTVAVLADRPEPLIVPGVWSAALDRTGTRLAVGERVKVIDPSASSGNRHGDGGAPRYSRAAWLARELNATAAELERALYYEGFTGAGYITRPVVYRVKDGDRQPLPLMGGDFVDWADEDRLVVGIEAGANKKPGVSALRLVGYNLASGKTTDIAAGPEAVDRLRERLAEGTGASLYLSSAWQTVWPTTAAAEVAVGNRGRFLTRGEEVVWVGAEGLTAGFSPGILIGGTADGSWLLLLRPARGAFRVYACNLAWR